MSTVGTMLYWDPLSREWFRADLAQRCYVSITTSRQIPAAEAQARPPGSQLIAQAGIMEAQAGSYPNSGGQSANAAQTGSTAGPAAQSVHITQNNNVAARRDPSTGATQYVATSAGAGVQSVWQEGPAPAITESAALRYGLQASKKFQGTERPYEPLDPRYKVRDGNRAAFFQAGRVFMVLYAEPMGQSSANTDITYDSRYGEAFHVKPRRFIVVTPGESSCTVVAIWTYENKGVAKRGVRKSDHAVVHTGHSPPDPRQFLADERASRGEDPMKTQKIRVIPDNHGDRLGVMSRINFAKVYTIEHNVKVRNIGLVHPGSTADLTTLFWTVQMEHATPAQSIAIHETFSRLRAQYAAQASSSTRPRRVARDSVMSTGSSSGSYRRSSFATSGSRQSRHSGRSRDAESEESDDSNVAEEDSDSDDDGDGDRR